MKKKYELCMKMYKNNTNEKLFAPFVILSTLFKILTFTLIFSVFTGFNNTIIQIVFDNCYVKLVKQSRSCNSK